MKRFFIILFIIFSFVSCSDNKNLLDLRDVPPQEREKKLDEFLNLAENEIVVADVNTNMGKIEIQLFPDKATKAVQNFVGLSSMGYYDGVVFHRVIDGFMIQGGDPTATGAGGQSFWGGSFEDEFSDDLKHNAAGILSMANAGPNTNGSQFFITLVPTPWLDGKHTIFGKVISGMDVVQAIGKVKTGRADKPIDDVVIESVKIEKK